ncbi:MAG: hypothetical protein WB762_31210 [Candidatus Sulfotelmatobacter sp.]
MLYRTLSAAVYGIDANLIQVEDDCCGVQTDQDQFHNVSLSAAAVPIGTEFCPRRIRPCFAIDPVDATCYKCPFCATPSGPQSYPPAGSTETPTRPSSNAPFRVCGGSVFGIPVTIPLRQGRD